MTSKIKLTWLLNKAEHPQQLIRLSRKYEAKAKTVIDILYTSSKFGIILNDNMIREILILYGFYLKEYTKLSYIRSTMMSSNPTINLGTLIGIDDESELNYIPKKLNKKYLNI